MRRYSPDNYAFNNPVSFIDPDGRKAYAPDTWSWNISSGGAVSYYLSGGKGGTGMSMDEWAGNVPTIFTPNAGGGGGFLGESKVFGETQAYRDLMLSFQNGGDFSLKTHNGYMSWWTGGALGDATTAQEMIAHMMKLKFYDNESSNFSLSNLWNSSIVRSLVSDSYTIGLSSNVTAFLGIGTTPINFTLLTRGKEPGLYFTPTVNVAIGTGVEGNAGITFGAGMYTGDPGQIQSSFLQGHTLGASVGLGFVVDASAGVSYAPVNISNPFGKQGGFINVSGQVGVGIQGSPVTGVNAQLNYQYTPIIKPIFQFK